MNLTEEQLKSIERRRTYIREYNKKRRHERRLAGLCTYCDTPAIPNRSMCEEHAEKNRSWAKMRRGQKSSESNATVATQVD